MARPTFRRSVQFLLASLLALAALAAPAAAAPVVSGEFELGTEIETNSKIAASANGDAWVALQGPEKDVAKVTPAGQVTEYELGVAGTSGVAVDGNGSIWVTRTDGVNRFSPADPEGTNDPFTIPGIEGNAPIAVGADSNLWVAAKDTVFRIPPADPDAVADFAIPGLQPTDIDAAGTQLVIADTNLLNQRILFVTLAGAPAGEFKVGGPPQGVAGDPNGAAGFTQPVNEPKEMGLLAATGLPLFLRPIPGEDPFGIALGADGAYWSAERNSDGVLRMTASGAITKLTGFAEGAEPRQITAAAGNALWVTLPGAGINSVGRVTGLEPPQPPAVPQRLTTPTGTRPTTQIKAGPKGRVVTAKKRARVVFRFRSPDSAALFECRLFRLTPPKNVRLKAPIFKDCKSPQRYKLKPGRYRFEVRAVNGAGVDRTAAKRSFRVVRVAR